MNAMQKKISLSSADSGEQTPADHSGAAEGMERRRFMEASLAVGAVALLGQAATVDAKEIPLPGTAAKVPAFDFGEMTVAELQERMAKFKLTSHALTQAYLTRIAAIDAAGPMLRSVIELNPDALAIADRLDAERKRGKVRGPLHGIPVLIKDNIDSADRMATTAGSLALAGSSSPRDAHIVQRLREAGAVLLGPIFVPIIPPADGAGAAARRGIPTCSIETRADQVRALVRRSRQVSPQWGWALKPMVRLSARLPSTGWWGSSRQ